VLEEGGTVRYEAQRYSQWREQAQSIPSKQKEEPEVPVQKAPRRSEQKGLSYRERQEFEALEEKMSILSERIDTLEASFSHAETTEDGTLAERTETYHDLREELDMAEQRWLELAEKL
jgi:ATP-binding cassette subfamily F protein uup